MSCVAFSSSAATSRFLGARTQQARRVSKLSSSAASVATSAAHHHVSGGGGAGWRGGDGGGGCGGGGDVGGGCGDESGTVGGKPGSEGSGSEGVLGASTSGRHTPMARSRSSSPAVALALARPTAQPLGRPAQQLVPDGVCVCMCAVFRTGCCVAISPSPRERLTPPSVGQPEAEASSVSTRGRSPSEQSAAPVPRFICAAASDSQRSLTRAGRPSRREHSQPNPPNAQRNSATRHRSARGGFSSMRLYERHLRHREPTRTGNCARTPTRTAEIAAAANCVARASVSMSSMAASPARRHGRSDERAPRWGHAREAQPEPRASRRASTTFAKCQVESRYVGMK